MEVLNQLLEFLQPTAVYKSIGEVAEIYTKYVVPVVIILSLVTRKIEMGVEALGDGARWTDALKDIKTAVIFTALYASIGWLVVQFHAAFMAIMYEHGSLSVITKHYHAMMLRAQEITEKGNFIEHAVNVTNLLTHTSLSWLLFWFSYFLLVLTYVILRLIYAISFGLLYVWGMAAVPSISSKLLNMSHAWFRSTLTLLMWPIIEATVMMLLAPVFEDWGNLLLPTTQASTLGQLSQSGLYLLFTFCNLVLIGFSIASFIMAVFIASNQNMMMGMTAPLVVAGGAAYSTFTSILKKAALPLAQPFAGRAFGLAEKANARGLPLLGSSLKHLGGLAMQGLNQVIPNAAGGTGQAAGGPAGGDLPGTSQAAGGPAGGDLPGAGPSIQDGLAGLGGQGANQATATTPAQSSLPDLGNQGPGEL